MELPGVTVYVWATSMEKAIGELARGRHYSSRKEAGSFPPPIPGAVETIVRSDLMLWEIIIRREKN